MNLIGLDLGMSIGWALGEPGARPEYGLFKLTRAKDDYGMLMTQYEEWLASFVQPGDVVAYESPIVHRNNQLHGIMIDCGLAVETERWCYQAGITYLSYMPATVKKAFAGHGHAKKPQMTARARELGYDLSSFQKDLRHNVADALGVWHRALTYCDKINNTNHATTALDPLFRR